MNEINLQVHEGRSVVGSREIAENFDKRHDHILRDIRSFQKDVPNFGEMFFESKLPDKYGRNQKIYLVNRDGFSLLVMGFTGSKALEWKLKYIEAFNKMEEKLKSGNYLSEEEKLKLQLFSKDPAEVASAHSKLLKLEVDKATLPLIAENKELKPKAKYHDKVLNKDGLITISVIAKDLGLPSAAKLNRIMNLNHIIFKDKSGTWCPYSGYEWLIAESYADYQSYDMDKAKPYLKWTEKGRKWIIENYDNWLSNALT